MLEFLHPRQNTHATQVTGHWQPVRLCLDRATQEWLNVGVLLRTAGGGTSFKLLQSMDGLRCLYDEDAAGAAHFLIKQAEYAIEEGRSIPAGWHIELGSERFVRGSSAQEIVSSLFQRMVPLARHQAGTDRVDREDHLHATRNVRATVRRLISDHLQLAKSATPDFWRNKPVQITRDGSTLHLDVQITSTTHGTTVHGAVASAWYRTQYHRNASINTAAAALMAACDAYPSGQNLLYLLQPPPNAPGLELSDHQAIAAEINTCRWLLEKRGATVRVAQAERTLALNILADLSQISTPLT